MNDKAQEKSVQFLSKKELDILVDQKDPSQEKPPKDTFIYLFHKHYSCSQHDHALNPSQSLPEDRELWECDTYRFEFNISTFIKSLIISTIDIAGLKVLLFLYKRISGSKYVDNFYRVGILNGLINGFGWINMMLVIYSIYERNFIYTDAVSLNYMAGLFFVSILGAAEMSFFNSKISPFLENVGLEYMRCFEAGYLDIFETEAELMKTMLRLNVDASSFFLSFLEDIRAKGGSVQTDVNGLANPSKKTDARLRKHYYFEIKKEEDRLVTDRPIRKVRFIEDAMEFEEMVFFYKFETEPSQWETEKVSGYNYVKNILEVYSPEHPYARFLMLVGFIGTIVVSFMKLDASDLSNHSENFVMKFIVKGALLFLNAVVTVVTMIFISQGIRTIWDRLCFVKGLTELISEETPPQGSLFRQKNSMINIFDFESLRTWASLRMIFMNMSQKKLEALSLSISVIVAIQLFTISVLGFFYFTATNPIEKAFFLQYIIFFGTPTIIYMIFVLLFIYLGAQVNNQYQEHIYLLKTLKITINKLYASYPTYTGNSGIKPSTYLFASGLRYLQMSFEGKEVTPAILKDNLETLNNAYDTIITELEIEEDHCPLKLLGIPMTDSFAGTVFGTILTVLLIPVSKYLAEVTGWD